MLLCTFSSWLGNNNLCNLNCRQSTCISNSYTFQSSILWWEAPVSVFLCIVSGSTVDIEVMFMIQSYSLCILLITESLDFYTPSLLLLCSGCRMSFLSALFLAVLGTETRAPRTRGNPFTTKLQLQA